MEQKPISISYRNVTLKDSYAFIPMALSCFSKTFNLAELKKGFFPHLFNKPENYNYCGVYPDKKFYSSAYFSYEKKQEFDNWYETVKNLEFNFKKEFEDYCWSDVCLLTKGCLEFRKIIIEQTKIDLNDPGIDPFNRSLTIASLCNLIFRKICMDENTIAVIPENGYNPNQQTSKKAEL